MVGSTSKGDRPTTVGHIAHIAAKSDRGPRAQLDLSDEQRDSYGNWILLCGVHHPQVDGQPEAFSTATLQAWKQQHEAWVERKLEESALRIEFGELEVLAKAIANHSPDMQLPSSQTYSAPGIEHKLGFNSLGASTKRRVRTGLVDVDTVQSFVRSFAEVSTTFPDELRKGFLAEFKGLTASGLSGDALYSGLLDFASGGSADFDTMAAGNAILTYLFQVCDVFDEPVPE